jgi:diguanylate cyclase (GGDEF)-like protein
MEMIVRAVWHAAEPARGLVESALELMTGTQAVAWCAYLVPEADGDWRVVAGNGKGAPPVGEIWTAHQLRRISEENESHGQGTPFFKHVMRPGHVDSAGQPTALVIAKPDPNRPQHASVHDVLHRLIDRLHLLLDHLPGLHRDSPIDPVTGVLSQQSVLHRLQEEVARSQRYGGDLSVLLIDVDATLAPEAEAAAQRWGNVVDHSVLRVIGDSLSQNLRQMDGAGRHGKDAFLVLLPETGAEEALHAGARLGQLIGQAIEKKALTMDQALPVDRRGASGWIPPAEDRRAEWPSISAPAFELRMGVSTYPVAARSAQELVAQAEAALQATRGSVDGPWLRHALPGLRLSPGKGFQCVCRRCGKIFEVDDRAHQRARRFCSHACYVETRRETERARDEAIRQLRKGGHSLREIARRYNLSPERVRQICQV